MTTPRTFRARLSPAFAVAALAVMVATGPAGGGALADERSQAEINATLRADPVIYAGLFAMGVAHGIRDICPDIEARMIRANLQALSLYNHARSLGFSRDEIRAFLRDDAEKAFLRAEVIAYYRERGANEEQPDTICALGRAEIAANSPAGEFLRAR